MDIIKVNYISVGCCSHFPSHTVTTVSLSQAANAQVCSQCHSPCSHAASRAVPPYTSAFPLDRWFTGVPCSRDTRRSVTALSGDSHSDALRRDVSKMSDVIRQPCRVHSPPFCRLRVLALGYGALRPSRRFKPAIAFRFTGMATPDTLVASIAVNGGYRS